MKNFDIVMPKMGETVQEATITKWFVAVGDTVEEDTPLAEIATDKVDSEIPSPVEGKVQEILYNENDTVAVGKVIARVAMEGEEGEEETEKAGETGEQEEESQQPAEEKVEKAREKSEEKSQPAAAEKQSKAVSEKVGVNEINSVSERFYSPLVKSIAREEGLTVDELESIPGSGREGRVNKDDIMNYIEQKKQGKAPQKEAPAATKTAAPETFGYEVPTGVAGEKDEVVQMDRMRKIIADHMIMSQRTSAHVTSVVEVDMTEIVQWREKHKKEFQEKYGEKITFMPIFAEAVSKALHDFPRVNASVNGDQIILKKDVNMGIAVALENYNLIVPVVKKADQLNLAGLSTEINRLVKAARSNKLKPEDIEGGTFTITNFGSFQNIIGTPIINQPQVAILATGAIQKKPDVLETSSGDVIAIRHKMYLSLSYDHRIIDGALGGAFLKRIADYLERFDVNREI